MELLMALVLTSPALADGELRWGDEPSATGPSIKIAGLPSSRCAILLQEEEFCDPEQSILGRRPWSTPPHLTVRRG